MNIIYDYLFRESKLILKYYLPLSFNSQSDKMVFKADGRFAHGGMFDRLKGAISVYAASQCIGKEFKISFTHPFDIRDYLEPNEYDWRIDEESLVKGWPAARPIFMYGEYKNPVRLVKNRNGESHFYYGYDSLDWLNKRYNKDFEFGTLYKKLFKPTARLQNYIDQYRKEIGGKYVVVHFRFMNLLGDKMEFDCNPTLPADQQMELMKSGVEEIRKVRAIHPECKIMLATDSANFVEYAKKEIPDLYIVPGEIKHIGTNEDTGDGANIKMFLDYYLIGEAEKVYGFVSDGMWKSAFPEYASKIGGCEFERKMF